MPRAKCFCTPKIQIMPLGPMSFFSRNKSRGLVVFAVVLICLCYLLYHRPTKAGEDEKRVPFTPVSRAAASPFPPVGEGLAREATVTRAERRFSSLGLPNSLLYHPITEDSLWLEALTDYVASRKDGKCNGSDFVTLVAADREFLHVLLNWLIAAQAVDPSLQNVLVASNNKEVCHLMNLMGIDSVHVPIASVVKITDLPFKNQRRFFLMRLAVIRVLSYLGCDVLYSDADAVTLKNFRPLLEKHGKADVIASREIFPADLGWKKICCMGWIFYRSSKSTGRSYSFIYSIATTHRLLADQMWQLAAEVDDIDPMMSDDQVHTVYYRCSLP